MKVNDNISDCRPEVIDLEQFVRRCAALMDRAVRRFASAYSGPYPIAGRTLAEVDHDERQNLNATLVIDDPQNGGSDAGAWLKSGKFDCVADAQPAGDESGYEHYQEIGCAIVTVFHNGIIWVMRISERGRINRLELGSDLRQIQRLLAAFNRALNGFCSQYPVVMVGGVAFNVNEARLMRQLLIDLCDGRRGK